MKVGLVIYGSLETMSGGYLYDRMLVSKLRARGDEVQVISQPRHAYGINLLDNFRRDAIPEVDLLIQDELNHPSWFLLNRRRPRPPVVSIVHHLRSSERRAAWQNAAYAHVEKAYLRGVDAFIFNSHTTHDAVLSLLGADKPHVVATPGGDRLHGATPEDVHSRLATSHTLRLVTVGNLIPGKGLEVLLSSLAGVQNKDISLDVVGAESSAPDFARRMRATAASLSLPIIFHGALSDVELQKILRAAHVFVLPSYYEGFGIAFLEAMTQGLAVIGAAAGAMPSLIRDGSNGYLVRPGEAQQLTQRLSVLVRDRDLLLRLSLNALADASSFPTWDQSTDRMREFLMSVVRLRN